MIGAILGSALFRMAALLGILAALVRLRVRIGRVLAAAPAVAALLFWRPGFGGGLARGVTKDGGAFLFDTAALVALIALIDIFGRLLKRTERLPRLMRALLALFADGRAALAGMPCVIGLLPMPGGAMVSAPMVEEIARESGAAVSAEDKTLVNYWFRHVWEYIFPVYPAVLAAAAIWGIDTAELAGRQLVLTFAMAAAGLVFILRRVPPLAARRSPGGEREGDDARAPTTRAGHLRAVAAGLAPIAAVLALWWALRLIGPAGYALVGWKPWDRASLCVSLVAAILAIAVLARVPRSWMLERVRSCMPLDMLLLMVGAMLFKEVVAASGAVGLLRNELDRLGAPTALVIFLLPFAAGILTGIAVAYVTVAFPLLAGLVALPGGPDPAATVLAFAAGYMGVLLSPVHICLVLTREYFDADIAKVYARLLLPVAAMLAVALTVYFTETLL